MGSLYQHCSTGGDFIFGGFFSKHYGVLGLQGFVCKYVWSILISWFFASCWQVMIIIQWTTWILEEGKKMLSSLSLRVKLNFFFSKNSALCGSKAKICNLCCFLQYIRSFSLEKLPINVALLFFFPKMFVKELIMSLLILS